MVKAPIQAPVVMQTGFINRIWALFFTALADHASGSVPIRLPLINVADLPNPVGLEGRWFMFQTKAMAQQLLFLIMLIGFGFTIAQ